MRLVVPALAVLLCGCGISLEYGKPDPPPRPSSDEQACYQRERLESGTAKGMVEWTTGNAHYNGAVDGLVFYRDGKRLPLDEVLIELGDDELRTTYHERLDQLARARRNYAIVMALGIAVTGAGTYVSRETIRTKTPGFAVTGSAALFLSGVGLWIYGHRQYRKWRGTHEAYQQVFVDGTLADRMQYVWSRSDRRAARKCGYDLISVPTP